MTEIYNAPKPRLSGWQWFKFIMIRTIFPPILLWDLIKLGANKLLGERVGNLVLPAQNQHFYMLKLDDEAASKHNNEHLVCKKHKIITHDDAHLDTFEVKHKSQKDIEPRYQKYIINFVGNNTCYESIIQEITEDAKALEANVIGFNFRGVGISSGKAKSKEDLVTDGIAQVQRLLDQGVSPQNITLKGHSLGAGIATLVTQHFHQLKQPINLFNSRSFSTITKFLVGHIRLERNEFRNAIGHKDSIRGIMLGWLAYPFIKFGVALTKWEINAGSAFKSIPNAYRDYIVVRSRKRIRDDRIDDAVIPHYASIHKELTSERRKEKRKIERAIKKLDSLLQQIDTPCPSQIDLADRKKQLLVETREKIKSDRKMETEDPNIDGHNANWSKLHNRSGKTALNFFKDFVERTEKDHAVKAVKKENLFNNK